MKNRKEKTEATGYELPKGIRKKGLLFCYLMLIPAVLGILQYVYVNLNSIVIAFTVKNSSGQEVFSLNNFKLLFVMLGDSDSTMWIALKNTFKYFIFGEIKLLFTFVVAYWLFKKVKGYKFYRTVLFLPSIISPLVLIAIFKNLIEVYGPLWTLFKDVFGVELPHFLGHPETATNTIIFYGLWMGFGATLLIFIGAMNRIPAEVLESAQLDGCTPWTEFFRIILPLGWETLSTMILLSLTMIFMSSGPILFFNGGQHETTTMAYWIFDQVRFGSYNYPSAVGIFFTVLAIPIVLIVRKLMIRLGSNVSY